MDAHFVLSSSDRPGVADRDTTWLQQNPRQRQGEENGTLRQFKLSTKNNTANKIPCHFSGTFSEWKNYSSPALFSTELNAVLWSIWT
jgi:hypothetical protein